MKAVGTTCEGMTRRTTLTPPVASTRISNQTRHPLLSAMDSNRYASKPRRACSRPGCSFLHAMRAMRKGEWVGGGLGHRDEGIDTRHQAAAHPSGLPSGMRDPPEDGLFTAAGGGDGTSASDAVS